MIVIGLCGGSGSGKTLVCQTILSCGIPVFESDAVYHRLIAEPTDCVRELAAQFGVEVLDDHGGIDRRALSRLVFSDRPDAKDNLQKLDEIAHRHVCHAFLQWKEERVSKGSPAIVLEAPLLFESGMDRLCTVTIAVTAPRALRLERIRERDGITAQEAQARIDAQRSDAELKRLCDYTVENTGTMSEVQNCIKELLEKILNQKDDAS